MNDEMYYKYWDLYETLLNEKVDKLRQYYDIDKIKKYGVYVWFKDENVFDIYGDKIQFYTKHKIIKEALPIVEEIKDFIHKYYDEM